MALVVICGQPCSGKSTAALCLASALEAMEPKPKVRIIDEFSLNLSRNRSYADMTAEKNLRGVLRSEVDRSLSKENITIVDSLNNIKGYRYELWCLARAAGIRYCVLFCDAEENYCREWNNNRHEKEEYSYEMKILEDESLRWHLGKRRRLGSAAEEKKSVNVPAKSRLWTEEDEARLSCDWSLATIVKSVGGEFIAALGE